MFYPTLFKRCLFLFTISTNRYVLRSINDTLIQQQQKLHPQHTNYILGLVLLSDKWCTLLYDAQHYHLSLDYRQTCIPVSNIIQKSRFLRLTCNFGNKTTYIANTNIPNHTHIHAHKRIHHTCGAWRWYVCWILHTNIEKNPGRNDTSTIRYAYKKILVAIERALSFPSAKWGGWLCRFHDEEHANLLNSMWLTAITFLCVGYGDIVPNTYCGRGITLTCGMVVSRERSNQDIIPTST